MATPLARLGATIVPPRLGRSFRWLLAATTVNNIGDGIALAAGPLLVASQTRDPLLVSMPRSPSPCRAPVRRARRYRRGPDGPQAAVHRGHVVRAVVLGLLASTIVTAS